MSGKRGSADLENDTRGIGTARVNCDVHLPSAAGCRQFVGKPTALQEEACAGRSQFGGGESEEAVERRQGAGGDDALWGQCDRLDLLRMNDDLGAGAPGRLYQKCRLPMVGFDEIKGPIQGNGQNQAWEARAGAEIGRWRREPGQQWREAKRVQNVSAPNECMIAGRDQLNRSSPTQDFGGQDF